MTEWKPKPTTSLSASSRWSRSWRPSPSSTGRRRSATAARRRCCACAFRARRPAWRAAARCCSTASRSATSGASIIDVDNPTVAIADTEIDRLTPITKSTQADIGLAGLTGQANIELKGADPKEPKLLDEAERGRPRRRNHRQSVGGHQSPADGAGHLHARRQGAVRARRLRQRRARAADRRPSRTRRNSPRRWPTIPTASTNSWPASPRCRTNWQAFPASSTAR